MTEEELLYLLDIDTGQTIDAEHVRLGIKRAFRKGIFEDISIQHDGTINNGHQRYYVWLAAFGEDHEVSVKVASRALTQMEWQEMTALAHEGATGRWNWDALANWEGVTTEDLLEWGFTEERLGLHDLLVDDDDLEGFASGALVTSDGVNVVIKTTQDVLNSIKESLFEFCNSHALSYEVKSS